MDFLQAHQQNNWQAVMSYEDINTSKGCGGQRWYCKWLLQQITPRCCILKKQSNHWLFQVARNKKIWHFMMLASHGVSVTHGDRPMVPSQGRISRITSPYGSVHQQNSTQLAMVWAPVRRLIPTGSCVLSFPYTHAMLVTAFLAKLHALVPAMSCPWWKKGPAQLSIPAPGGNRLIPAAFSPELYPF